MTPESVRTHLRSSLTVAIKQRDAVAMAALRSVLGAIDNAEAVDPAPPTRLSAGPIAGALVGLGRGDVARRELTTADPEETMRTEIEEREAAAREYEDARRPDQAERLRSEAAVIRREHRALTAEP